jgi:transposase
LFGPNGREFLTELSFSTADRTIIEAHISVIDKRDTQIAAFEDEIERHVLESPAARRLLTIPGVGQFTAEVVVAEVGGIERFDSDKSLVSYAGLDPVVHQFGEKEIHGSIRKEGSAQLRWALIQAVHTAVRCDDYFGNFYTRLKRRKNHQVAIVSTARKMIVSICYMISRNELYDPPEVCA